MTRGGRAFLIAVSPVAVALYGIVRIAHWLRGQLAREWDAWGHGVLAFLPFLALLALLSLF